MNDKPATLTPRGLLIAAIVDAINVYQGDPVFGHHIKDESSSHALGWRTESFGTRSTTWQNR